jgi:hypothetical protein
VRHAAYAYVRAILVAGALALAVVLLPALLGSSHARAAEAPSVGVRPTAPVAIGLTRPASVTVGEAKVGGGRVKVRWTGEAPAAASYAVSVDGAVVAVVPSTRTATKVRLLPGKHRVGVRVVLGTSMSPLRAVTVRVAHAPPAPPLDVHVLQAGSGVGYLVWQPPVLRPGQVVARYRIEVRGRTVTVPATARSLRITWNRSATSVGASVRAVTRAGLRGPWAEGTLRPGGGGYAPLVAPAFTVGDTGSAAPGPEIPAAATLTVTPTWTVTHPRGIAGIVLDGRVVAIAGCNPTGQATGTGRRAVNLQLAFSAVVTGCDGRSASYTRRFVAADGTDAWLGGSASWSRKVSTTAFGSDAISGVDGDYVGWGFGPFSALAVTGVRQPGGGILRISTGGHMIEKISTDAPARSERTVLWQSSFSTPVSQSFYARVGTGPVELDSFALLRPVADSTPVVSLTGRRTLSSGGHSAFPGATRLRDGRIIAVWRQGGGHNALDGTVRASWSSDGGATWTDDRKVLAVDGSDVRDPSLWVADDGSLMMVVYYKNSSTGFIRGVWLHRSIDGGETWDAGRQLPTGYSGASCGNPPVKVGDRWVLPLYAFSSSRSTRFSAYAATSTDGVTFGTPQLVLDGDAQGIAASEPGLNVLPNGNLVMTMRATSQWALSTDRGRTWVLRASPFDSASRHASVVDSRGRLITVYRGWAGYGAELRVSTNGGASFGPPRVIATGPSRMDYAAFVPLGGDRFLLVLAMEYGNGDLSDVTARVVKVA